MADDYGKPITIQIISAPKLLDEDIKNSERFVLEYLTSVYSTDADITITLYVARSASLDYEAVQTFVLSKDFKRFKRKIKQIGSIINYYLQVDWEGKEFEITSLQVRRKIFPVGKL